jgi:hypothetical protein
MHIPGPIDRYAPTEIDRRARSVRGFPNHTPPAQTTILIEINEKWAATDGAYTRMDDRNG